MSEQRLNPIRVMIVDDHMMVRDGLKMFLSIYDDIAVVAEAEDGAQAVALCAQRQPEVVLMDMVMPNVDGPTATQRIHARFPDVQVIALTSFVEEALVQRAIGAGAIGYLLKDVHADKLAEAIRDAHRGRATITARAAQALVRRTGGPPEPGHDLTPREREVLALLVDGKTNQEIADYLTISLGTARLHVSNILAKLGVSNRTEAALLAVKQRMAVVETVR
jgi:NarL family two-component system response regulator LiaR